MAVTFSKEDYYTRAPGEDAVLAMLWGKYSTSCLDGSYFTLSIQLPFHRDVLSTCQFAEANSPDWNEPKEVMGGGSPVTSRQVRRFKERLTTAPTH